MNMKNIKLVIAYDGSAYLGWQKTKEGPSIEESLQDLLEQILQEKISLQAASRTDAGVHAQGQVVNFFSSNTAIDLPRLQYSLNCLLPRDIVVRSIQHVPDDFHPTLHCVGKEYRYTICNSSMQLPHHRFYSWHCPFELNLEAMRHALNILIGTHDFSAFCNVKKNASYEDHIREVKSISIVNLPENRLEVHVTGNHFLYKMVRNIVGTLVYVGKGMLTVESIAQLLIDRDRTHAGITAPAHGLSLHQVYYSHV